GGTSREITGRSAAHRAARESTGRSAPRRYSSGVSLSRFREICLTFPFNGQEIVADAASITTRWSSVLPSAYSTVAVIGKSNTRRLGSANVAATDAASSDTFHVIVSDGRSCPKIHRSK